MPARQGSFHALPDQTGTTRAGPMESRNAPPLLSSSSPRRKVGVLTFHRCINYGSYWQARCLVEGLRARGHEAVILDHESQRVKAAEWECGFQPVLPTPVPKPDFLLYGLKMLKFFRAFETLPLSHRFPLERPDAMQGCDTVVVGSDEVWNLSHPWYGGCPLFWGRGVRAQRLVSYAASFGNYDASGGLDPFWAGQLRSFASISVRDENSRQIIRGALGTEPELVLDPCLQFPVRPRSGYRAPRRPYVAVYGHNFSPFFQDQVRRWAETRGCPLISIGYRNDWADRQWISAGPHEFAHFIRRAAAVATNFFHGCVFALRNARPFVCETSPYRSLKVRNLMSALNGEQHLVAEETPDDRYDAVLGGPVEPAVLRRIEELRVKSDAYLDRAVA